MLLNRLGFYVFNEYDLNTLLDAQVAKVKKEIENNIRLKLPENEAEYTTQQIEKYKIQPIEIDSDNLTVSAMEQMIPAESFPQSFIIRDGESYPKQVLSFHLPFKGDPTFLRCVPSSRILWTEEIMTENNEIIFEMINFNNSTEDIKMTRDKFVDNLKKQSLNVNNQIIQYNNNLENVVKDAIKLTTEKMHKDSEFLKELGTPLKK